jgi:hypothetical protein
VCRASADWASVGGPGQKVEVTTSKPVVIRPGRVRSDSGKPARPVGLTPLGPDPMRQRASVSKCAPMSPAMAVALRPYAREQGVGSAVSAYEARLIGTSTLAAVGRPRVVPGG